MSTHSHLRSNGPWLEPLVATDTAACDFLLSLQNENSRSCCRRVRGLKSRTTENLFDEFAAALQFPYYFGENWNAFDECVTDLEWLPADGYVLLVSDSMHLLEAESAEEQANFYRLLERAGREWATPAKDPTPRSGKTFHVFLQVAPADVKSLEAKLKAAKVASCPPHKL